MSDIQDRGHYSGDFVCEGIEEGNISKVADLTVVVGEVLQKIFWKQDGLNRPKACLYHLGYQRYLGKASYWELCLSKRP